MRHRALAADVLAVLVVGVQRLVVDRSWRKFTPSATAALATAHLPDVPADLAVQLRRGARGLAHVAFHLRAVQQREALVVVGPEDVEVAGGERVDKARLLDVAAELQVALRLREGERAVVVPPAHRALESRREPRLAGGDVVDAVARVRGAIRDLEEAGRAQARGRSVVAQPVDERDRRVAARERQQDVGLRSVGPDVRRRLVDRHRGDAADVVALRERRFGEERVARVHVVHEAAEQSRRGALSGRLSRYAA